jgi:hypothetical protein
MRTSVHIPDDLLKRAKKKAAEEGRTLTSLIEEGLRIVLAPRQKGSLRKGRITLPVSKATGGFAPGIDPIKVNTQVEEMDDLERFARTTRSS